MKMNILKINDFKRKDDLLIKEFGNVTIVFTTAENDRSFNRNLEEGIKNLNSLKHNFELNNLSFIKQIHSDYIYTFKGSSINENEGDSIITEEVNSGIGIFTADCVPVLIFDEETKALAAIHSGWKGTIVSITKKTLEKMILENNININTTKIIMGPHIKKCCYEVSEELKENFLKVTKIEENELFNNRNLSLEECILKDVKELGIKEDNIYSLDLCTYCSKDIKLFSYRKSVGTYGRLFSLIFRK